MPKLSEMIRFGNNGALTPSKWKLIAETLPGCLKPEWPVVLSDVLVGIEVEVERGREPLNSGWSSLWQAKDDNSLRNNGIEFVSLPLRGLQIGAALNALMDSMRPTVEFSHRTSIHVHMDVRSLTPEEIAKIMLVYLTVEPQLYSYVGEERERNIFCLPWYEIPAVEAVFDRIKSFAAIPGERPIGVQTNDERYSGLNLAPMTTFGTMEFRHLGGTRDIPRIMEWINLILSIRKYALAAPMSYLIEEIIGLNTNSQYRGFAQKMFGDMFYQAFTNLATLDERLAMGVISVKRALFSNKFLNQLKGQFEGSDAQKILLKRPLRATTVRQEAPRRVAQPQPRPVDVQMFVPNRGMAGIIVNDLPAQRIPE